MSSGRARARLHTDAIGVIGVLAVVALVVAYWQRPLMLLSFVAAAVIAVDVARADLATRRIPNRSVGLMGCLTAMAAAVAWMTGASAWSAVAGLAVAGSPVLIFHLMSPAGMGFGDVKWSAVLGGLVGLVAWPLALLVPLVGSVVAIVMAAVTRQRRIAFAPALSLGALFAVTLGPLWIGGAE